MNNHKTIKTEQGIFTLPFDYESVFQKKILFITGVGRSGTTILGKLIGSFKNTYYLFEPAAVRLLLFLQAKRIIDKRLCSLLVQSLLFEDYFLQVIHGRALNFNPKNDSYVGNYQNRADIKKRWSKFSRRQDVIKHLKQQDPLFVIKIPQLQCLFAAAKSIFLQPRFVHIIRNGLDVISSAVKRGWYGDAYLSRDMVDWAEKRKTFNVPWYLDRESKEHFGRWNQASRAASIWRNLTEQGMAFCAKNPKACTQFLYEDFVRSPSSFVSRLERTFGLKRTKITEYHLGSIKNRKAEPRSFFYKDIAAPERSKFMLLMKKLGYE